MYLVVLSLHVLITDVCSSFLGLFIARAKNQEKETQTLTSCQMLPVTSVMGDKTVCVGGGSLCRLVR